MASEKYFHVFSYRLLQESKDNVLTDKNNIVVSERLAKKMFNTTENIVDKTLLWNHQGFEDAMNARKYVSIASTSKATATRDLQDLVQKGIFKPIGGGRSTRYELSLQLKKV